MRLSPARPANWISDADVFDLLQIADDLRQNILYVDGPGGFIQGDTLPDHIYVDLRKHSLEVIKKPDALLVTAALVIWVANSLLVSRAISVFKYEFMMVQAKRAICESDGVDYREDVDVHSVYCKQLPRFRDMLFDNEPDPGHEHMIALRVFQINFKDAVRPDPTPSPLSEA